MNCACNDVYWYAVMIIDVVQKCGENIKYPSSLYVKLFPCWKIRKRPDGFPDDCNPCKRMPTVPVVVGLERNMSSLFGPWGWLPE